MDLLPVFARWLHFLAGVMWIGLLYYFNFVQVPALKAAAADGTAGGAFALDGVGGGVVIGWSDKIRVNAVTDPLKPKNMARRSTEHRVCQRRSPGRTHLTARTTSTTATRFAG